MRRRTLIAGVAAGAAAVLAVAGSLAPQAQAAKDSVVIAWQVDPQTWDPNKRTVPVRQSLYKMVYDQLLTQAPDIKLEASLATKWSQSADGKTVTLDIRDNAYWHDGTKVTSADVKYTFLERGKAGHKIDLVRIWRNVADIETPDADPRGHQAEQADGDGDPVAGVPGQLRGAEAPCREGRRRRLRRQADGQRALQGRGLSAQLAHRARSLRQILGAEAENPQGDDSDHEGPVGPRRGGPVRPGRFRAGRADPRSRTAGQDGGAERPDLPDLARDPAADPQRQGVRRQECPAGRASRDQQEGDLAGALCRQGGAVVDRRAARHARLCQGFRIPLRSGEIEGAAGEIRFSARTSR